MKNACAIVLKVKEYFLQAKANFYTFRNEINETVLQVKE
jgi:hypothetical protein